MDMKTVDSLIAALALNQDLLIRIQGKVIALERTLQQQKPILYQIYSNHLNEVRQNPEPELRVLSQSELADLHTKLLQE
jgi:hypothetical protein